ncbi:hypothetical protein Poli38472_004184 [Pythium oligandrum]|uniref:Knr4/Smi1-like domain-containing protein n=1 Tax=Pythium oligandrum TaxID=41045 RepID=A0A8K1FMM3_PYTOL|nr:hypothetical protein Poli38472_004184 [Pythium oligandrum]|eukprot:TMW66419.1 hypothetical protein Poli38472_004184 [Pythium oligandrum]
MSGVQVLKDSHPRQGGMDEDECEQCIHDIVSWFQRKADLSERAAKSTDVESLEEELGREIPEALRSLLKKQSGGLWFDEYRSLTPSDIVRTAEKLAGVGGWKTSFIPFAADLDGNALITDAASKSAVYIFGDDGKGRQLAPTLSEYLEEYRNRLLSGQFDYVEDVGLVERSRK